MKADDMKIAVWIYLVSVIVSLALSFTEVILPQYLDDVARRDASIERHNDWYRPALTWGKVVGSVTLSFVPVINTIGAIMLTLEQASKFFDWCSKKLDKPVVPKDAP